MRKKSTSNALIHASSPYLLQHAHNPVNWVEWSDEVFQSAKAENKLVLVSIGYSTCHWCHVMERESFMDQAVAELMNKHLICIKVDREERPDVDHLYMAAVQLMQQQGGWPLNCFLLPDGRPIFGGTYYPKESWKRIILQLSNLYATQPETVHRYAQQVEEGLSTSNQIIPLEIEEKFPMNLLEQAVNQWKKDFDFDDGGQRRAPKFPMPNNLEFLLRYGQQANDTTCLRHVHKTLEKMAFGGIYDQIGGGFARYSVDLHWKVPHFEKMLYDNAQMLSIYAHGYQHQQNEVYKEVIEQTIAWLNREMKQDEGAFYAAVDADSEGEEGKFYCWTKEELQDVLQEDYSWFSRYFSINQKGYWENGNYLLIRTTDFVNFCRNHNLSYERYHLQLKKAITKLHAHRNKRTAPATDDKLLSAWNAMLIVGFIDAAKALQNPSYLNMAIQTGEWLIHHQMDPSTGKLFRTRKNGVSKIAGFLEDYAWGIRAFLQLHQATFDDEWLQKAHKLMQIVQNDFYNPHSKMYNFTGRDCALLIQKIEIEDNVIPASNSVMAHNLFELGKLMDEPSYQTAARQLLSNIFHDIQSYPAAYSNWLLLALNYSQPFYEVVITGENAREKSFELFAKYLPNAIFTGGNSVLSPLLQNRNTSPQLAIYICQQNACLAPTQSVEQAVQLLQK